MTTTVERDRLAAVERRRESPEAYVEYQILSAERGLWPRVLRQISNPIGKRALEIGCGTGGLAIFLASRGMRVSAIDNEQYDAAALETARREACKRGLTVDVRHGDAVALPYPTSAFELVVCSQVFEHLSDPDAALREIARVLKPGGVALVDFPGWFYAYGGHIDDAIRWPWAHLLPPSVVRAWCERRGTLNDYAVYRTLGGLTYRRFEWLARSVGLRIEQRRPMWFLTHPGRALIGGAVADALRAFRADPSEVLRFGLLVVTAPLALVPWLRELFAAGQKYTLTKHRM